MNIRKRGNRYPWNKNLLLFMPFFLLLAGCLYPQDLRTEQSSDSAQQLEWVQEAVDRYRKESGGLLPIKTKPAETPIYQKYPVEFSLIKKYLPAIPSHAFEQGGHIQYVLINVESDPQVKWLDLAIGAQIRQVQTAVDQYWWEHRQLPAVIEDQRYPGYYGIDYTKLGMDEQTVQSPFTGHYLPLMVDVLGHVGIDYAMDIGYFLETLNQKERLDQWEKKDMRLILAENSFYVPAFSFTYQLKNDRPVPQNPF